MIEEELQEKLNELQNEEKEDLFVLRKRSQISSELPKWKESMYKKHGEDATFFLCKKDNIYFCTSYKTCISYPVYTGNCPVCKRDRCFFCQRCPTDVEISDGCLHSKKNIKYDLSRWPKIYISNWKR